jgi:orotidine-5'-phosphate decarboxylase
MTFQQKLDAIIKKNNSVVCVGLDSDIKKLPQHIQKKHNSQFLFNKEIINATHDLVCAYKPNSAFYEAQGVEGIRQLKMTCDYLKKNYSDIPIILDAKRADIGSTNEGYVSFAFDYLRVDAITLHPYLGKEALLPFLNKKEKGCIILCRTSNPGAGEFQDLSINSEPFYKKVARQVTKEWNVNGNCLMVVGATYPKELKKIRLIAGDMTFLIPGIGAQGGDLEKTIRFGINAHKKGMIINSSRGIIFASKMKDFAQEARRQTEILRRNINQIIKQI